MPLSKAKGRTKPNMQGWIKLHRQFTTWEWFYNSEMVHLFLYLLLKANHEDNEWQNVMIKKGQVVTGRRKLHENTGISYQTLRTCIKRLKSTNEITTKPTSKYTIITIVNYSQYQQIKDKPTSIPTSVPTNDQPATNQQVTTNKKDKNVKNEKKHSIATQDVANKEVNIIITLFRNSINPTINYGNTTSRHATDDLIKRMGIDKLTRVVKYAVSVQGQDYAPTITTPYQLKEKLAALLIYYKKNNKQREVIKI